MAEFLLLGSQVGDVLVVGFGAQRDPFHDLETVAVEPPVLGGIVRHEAHRGDPQVDEDLGADPVLAGVDREAQLDVGLDRVAAFVLEGVGTQLVAEADPPALVAPQVDDDTALFGGHPLEGQVELDAAVAA